jgi:hypothetical protein
VYYTSQNGGIARRNLRTGESAFFTPRAPEGKSYRWNWNTPFILSAHNPRIYYVAGNHVFRSLDRGRDLREISPEVARTDKGSATALAESPRNPEVLYVGTDDGALWVTRDGGRTWSDIAKNVGLPKPMQVASIEASRYVDGRVYVAFDGHRSDLDAPFAYASEDFGQTWRSLNGGLPGVGSTRVLREDIRNADLLFLGTEFGAWASLDGGVSWTSLNTNLPTVAVHEFAIHPDPEVGEVVAATHGRSLWVLDASPLRQLSAELLKTKVALLQPKAHERSHADVARGRTNRRFAGENPAPGAVIYYHVGEKPKEIKLEVQDAAGNVVRVLPSSGEPGLQRSVWDLNRVGRREPRAGGGEAGTAATPPAGEGTGGEGTGGEGSPQSEAAGQRRTTLEATLQNVRPRQAEAGTYRVVLTVDGETTVKTLELRPDPRRPGGVSAEEEEQGERREEEEEEGGIGD